MESGHKNILVTSPGFDRKASCQVGRHPVRSVDGNRYGGRDHVRVFGHTEGRVIKGVNWAGGCDVLSRSVEVTERSRRCEGGVGSDELSGESGDGCEISRLDGMDESGDGGGAKGAMGVCHKLGVGEAADREVCVIGGGISKD